MEFDLWLIHWVWCRYAQIGTTEYQIDDSDCIESSEIDFTFSKTNPGCIYDMEHTIWDRKQPFNRKNVDCEMFAQRKTSQSTMNFERKENSLWT